MAEEAQHQTLEETWDKKKIIIGIIIFLFLAGGAFAAKKYIFPSSVIPQDNTHIQTTIGVKGAETSTSSDSNNTPTQQSDNKASFSLPSTQDVQNQIQNIQQQVSNLNVADIASSSPQIQQVIQQIQQLPNLPKEAAKAACQQLCNNL